MPKETNSLTVSALTEKIRQALESNFFGIEVQGEISNFKKQSSGHLYLTLKDSKAQIGAVMFAGSAKKLKILPKNGDQVVALGSINVYPPHGKYQIVIESLKPVGVGELLLRLEELKREIKRRGWFEKEHKKALPPFPKRIGIITSPTGAAIQDILNVLARRFSGLEIILYPVRVQGETAAAEVTQAIEQMNKHALADVLIVGRGGGSLEDLFAFNEEVVARAVFESTIPIICAVGHESDHSIAEYVADMRAPTPSAAAELVIQEKAQLIQTLESARMQTAALLKRKVSEERKLLTLLASSPLLKSPYALLGTHIQRLDNLQEALKIAQMNKLKEAKQKLTGLKKSLQLSNPALQVRRTKQRFNQLSLNLNKDFSLLLKRKKSTLKSIEETLKAIDPKHLLQRGYSILLSDNKNSVINSVDKLQKNQSVKILLSDGSAKALIEETTHGKAKEL